MKQTFTILFQITIGILLTASVFSQTPEKMSYQAVVRNSSDALVTNTQIGMQVSILQGSETGAALYVETQTPITNVNGMVSIEIGAGTTLSGDFTSIDWLNGPYFLKTETDPTGGNSYTITGISQLLSVPYALHSKSAEMVTGAIMEVDPEFTSSQAASITVTDIVNLSNLSGTNTGDQDISGILVNTQTIQDTAAQIRADIPDVTEFLTQEIDPGVPSGTQNGEMQYWNGSEWVTIPAGNQGQVLTFVNETPIWLGTPITEDIVVNSATGKIWTDRNLGASQVATSITDADAYGDLYQWGRTTDGHEKRNSLTTSVLSISDIPGHGNFIINPNSPNDWRSPENNNLWQGPSGINNPCPDGFRLPTEVEWEAERKSWSSNNGAGAFGSQLKLLYSGFRSSGSGSDYSGSNGYYWSSTVSGTSSRNLYFFSGNALVLNYGRALGSSVRCIKH